MVHPTMNNLNLEGFFNVKRRSRTKRKLKKLLNDKLARKTARLARFKRRNEGTMSGYERRRRMNRGEVAISNAIPATPSRAGTPRIVHTAPAVVTPSERLGRRNAEAKSARELKREKKACKELRMAGRRLNINDHIVHPSTVVDVFDGMSNIVAEVRTDNDNIS